MHYFVIILRIFFILLIFKGVYGAIPWLHVEGNKILDPNGNVVILRGVSMIDLGATEEWEGGAIEMVDRLTDKNDNCQNQTRDINLFV